MPDLIFHAGLTKTASSFLQRKLFNGKIHTLNHSISWNKDAIEAKKLQKYFSEYAPSIWSSKEADNFFEAHKQLKTNVLISHESLYRQGIFSPHGSQRKYQAEPFLFASHLQQISENIWKDIGRVKVFYFFRKQTEWLPSYYAHVCYHLKNPSQIDFEERVKKILQYPHQLGGNTLHYDRLFDELSKRLGKTNVMAIPYEALTEKETWIKLREFTGLTNLAKGFDFENQTVNVKKINKSTWMLSNKASSRLDKLSNKLNITKKRHIFLPEYLKYDIEKNFYVSNKNLEKLIDINLGKYGY